MKIRFLIQNFLAHVILVVIILTNLIYILNNIDFKFKSINHKLRINGSIFNSKIFEDSEINNLSAIDCNTYIETYYEKLYDNHGYNFFGSCGYIAVGMILSYYDTYLNDDIISEAYDVESNNISRSPGILFDNVTHEDAYLYGKNRVSDMTSEDYIDLCRKKANINSAAPSLHAKLITIGDELNYYNYDPNLPCGTELYMQIDVAAKYLIDLGFVMGDDFEIISSYSEPDLTPAEFTKKYISQGYPVAVNAYNFGEDYGHSCVAFKIENNDFRVHMGNGSNPTLLNPYFKNIEDAMVIKFNMPHTHSNNYIINGKEYCYCTDEVEIYHNHSYSLENTNSLTHTRKCACGLAKTESHNFNDYAVISGMDGNRWHNVRCACGEYKRQVHTFVTVNSSSGPYRYCNKCFWSELKFEHLKLFSYMTS